ncbi:MAG: DegT/DnrJ/EryC1/StrS family aminotransferase [Flavobacteriaceae bacterium]|jgi:UDP-2-acetamido-2-deoxy-ribo-hexuluronate aminotransferase|nr:DegT/DnrJ/EryC1/StrS family aminotransferase [Flavobacteriaceae bacterium]
MENIRMVDLQGQYQQIEKPLSEKMKAVIESTAFINGPAVQEFQKNLEAYLGVKHVIPCANGTDALQIALMGLGLKPGDEVITADFTFAATVEVIALLGLTPVLVDVDPQTFNLDLEAVAARIGARTKAIIPVHLFGQTVDMEPLMALAKTHQLYVVEDNAQAIGATYTFSSGEKQKAGTIGDIGTTSFFPSKNLGAYGDGGALFTNDDALAHALRGIVNHGMYQRYHHDVVGVNSRLDALQAAVLDTKLPLLDFYNERRKMAAALYTERLQANEAITTPHRSGDCDSHVFHQYTLKIKGVDRDKLVQQLGAFGIPTGVYYPIPLHSQKAYTDPDYNESDFKVTNQIVNEVLSLPMHTELTVEQIDYICEKLLHSVASN